MIRIGVFQERNKLIIKKITKKNENIRHVTYASKIECKKFIKFIKHSNLPENRFTSKYPIRIPTYDNLKTFSLNTNKFITQDMSLLDFYFQIGNLIYSPQGLDPNNLNAGKWQKYWTSKTIWERYE